MAPQRYRYFDRFNKASLTITLPKELKELIKLGDPNEIITFLLEENYDRISDGKLESLIEYRRNKLRYEAEKIVHKIIKEHMKKYTIELREESNEVKIEVGKIIKRFNKQVMKERKTFRKDIINLTENLFDELLKEELNEKNKLNEAEEATKETYVDKEGIDDTTSNMEEYLEDLEEE